MRDYFVTTRLLGSASVLALIVSASAAQAGALPSGGHFVSGKGDIGKAGQSLTVKQSSTTGIIDWSKFSVGANKTATFENGAGATLNRVTGGNLSRIAGSLQATGSLYLLNSSGVIVNGAGRVVTGGRFVISSGDISNSAFDVDQRRLSVATARIVNRGSITAGGEVKLVGNSAKNSGVIAGSVAKLRADNGEALNTGTIHATGYAHRAADILVISKTGQTKIAGNLITTNRDGSGGEIETSGHRVSISGNIDAGKGGSWLIDPENLTVNASAAKAIDKSLNKGTNVTLKTTKTGTNGPGTTSSGPGDIVIASALSWNAAGMLTLDAYRSVKIDKSISIQGAGGLAIDTDEGGKNGSYSLGHGSSVDYGTSDSGGTLEINGNSYTLLYTMSAVQNINKHLKGDCALATSLDASTTKHWKPIGTNGADTVFNSGHGFEGVFDGLGNAIGNLNVNIHSNNNAGLFGYSSGTIRDINLTNETVQGGYDVGGLVGTNGGAVSYAYVSDVVSSDGDDAIGGLIGSNVGTIQNSVAISTVSGQNEVGGLVGYNGGGIAHVRAKTSVKGNESDTGGLVGESYGGSITDAYAFGKVAGLQWVGGLVGDSNTSITASHSRGKVSGEDGVGGLVGYNGGSVSNSYSADSAEGYWAGGLIGYNTNSISNDYAMGTVSGTFVGGLVGYNYSGTISDSYSIGSLSGSNVGGLVGDNSGSVVQSYWDTETSGQKHSAGGKGLTTAKLQSGLPKGFSSSIWAIDSDVNNGLPYLIALKSSY